MTELEAFRKEYQDTPSGRIRVLSVLYDTHSLIEHGGASSLLERLYEYSLLHDLDGLLLETKYNFGTTIRVPAFFLSYHYNHSVKDSLMRDDICKCLNSKSYIFSATHTPVAVAPGNRTHLNLHYTIRFKSELCLKILNGKYAFSKKILELFKTAQNANNLIKQTEEMLIMTREQVGEEGMYIKGQGVN